MDDIRRLRGEETERWRTQVRCSALELVLVTRQLAVLLGSGVHLVDALHSLADQSDSPELVEVLWSVEDSVASGTQLSRAMARFPRVFPPVYLRMVAVGEETGALVLCLQKLSDWLERDHRLGQQVRSALTYPAFVLGLALLMSLWLFGRVLPPFLELMRGMDVPLPWPTRLMAAGLAFFGSPWAWAAVAALALAALGPGRKPLQSPENQRRLWRLVLAVPAAGKVLLMVHLTRLTTAAEALLSSGGDVLVSWRLALAATGNPLLSEQGPAMVTTLSEGGQASDHFEAHPELFSPALTQMVRAGEESGKLPRLLRDLTRLLETETEYRLLLFTALLEPLLLVVVSGLLTFVLLAIFLPLYAYLRTL